MITAAYETCAMFRSDPPLLTVERGGSMREFSGVQATRLWALAPKFPSLTDFIDAVFEATPPQQEMPHGTQDQV